MNQNAGERNDLGMMREIEERVRSRLLVLERETQSLRFRTRVLSFGLVGTLILVIVVALNPDFLAVTGIHAGSETLSVRSLELLDDQGLRRGEWSVDDEGSARLSLMDRQGRPRMNLSVLSGGFPGMSLMNSAGQQRAALGLLPDETTTLVFADGGGIPRAVLGLTRGDAAHLVFADAEGVSRVALGLEGDGMGTVVLPESQGTDPEGR